MYLPGQDQPKIDISSIGSLQTMNFHLRTSRRENSLSVLTAIEYFTYTEFPELSVVERQLRKLMQKGMDVWSS